MKMGFFLTQQNKKVILSSKLSKNCNVYANGLLLRVGRERVHASGSLRSDMATS